MTIKEKQEMFAEFLRGEGYTPEIDSDGDVRFKKEGGIYFLDVDDDDEYFRVVYPGLYHIRDSADDHSKTLAACAAATARCKVAKLFLVRDQVWAAVEIFVAKPESFKSGVFACRALVAAWCPPVRGFDDPGRRAAKLDA